MNKENLQPQTKTKEELLLEVNNAFPSVYSKEDVLIILNALKPEKSEDEEISEERMKKIKDELKSDLKSEVEDAIDGVDFSDYVDKDDATFEIQQGNEIVLESVKIDDRNIKRAIIDNLNW